MSERRLTPWWLRTGASLALLAAGLVFAATNVSRTATTTTAPRATPTTLRSTVRLVVVRRNIPYGTTSSRRLDLYEPAGTKPNSASIIWLHGGGFSSGDKADMAIYAHAFAVRGYVSVAINYRLRSGISWFDLATRKDAERDAYADAIAAIQFLRTHAHDYRIDPAAIFVAGYSAGAITAYDLAYPPAAAPDAHVAGSIPIAGYPYGTPKPGAPPVLAFHGSNDPVVPYAWDAHACSRARAIGDECTLVTFRAGHEIGITKRNAITSRIAAFVATTNRRGKIA